MKSKIYMTAVDTGWINDEKPVELAAKHHQKHNFQVSQLDVCQVYFCQIDFSFSIMHFIIDIHTLSLLSSLSHTHTHTQPLSLSLTCTYFLPSTPPFSLPPPTQTPIDEQDAASRVLDPIIAPLLALQRGEVVEPPWGFFLKDYQKCEW